MKRFLGFSYVSERVVGVILFCVVLLVNLSVTSVAIASVANGGTPQVGSAQIFSSSVYAKATGGQSNLIVYNMAADTEASSGRTFAKCILVHGYVISMKRLSDVLQAKAQDKALRTFAGIYFGKELTSMLASQHCEQVVVMMQESIATTGLEMTQRTEEFTRYMGCSEENPCALYGHSKGGLVVTTMARRCMQEISNAGESVCRGIRKFYSASGNNLGAVYGALLYGLYSTDPYHPKLREFERKAHLAGIDVAMTGPSAMDYVPGKTNPIWVDISAIAPMEGGVPLAIANRVQLNRAGWLVGDYAAADSGYRWDTGVRPPTGCGPWIDFSARISCAVTGRSSAAMHDESLKDYLEYGLDLWRGDLRFKSDVSSGYLDSLSWQTNQQGDGMADYAGSLGVCGLGGSAVQRCTDLGAVNHAGTAGSGPAVRSDLDEFLRD